MMSIKVQKFKSVSFCRLFCLMYAQEVFSQHEKIIKGLKAGQGQQRPKVKKSHFFQHYCLLFAQEAFPQPEKSKAQKADEGHQRPQSKKVKKSHFINCHYLIDTQDAFPYPKKVVKPKSQIRFKGQRLNNVSSYQLLWKHLDFHYLDIIFNKGGDYNLMKVVRYL